VRSGLTANSTPIGNYGQDRFAALAESRKAAGDGLA